jgi:hypothetical protein
VDLEFIHRSLLKVRVFLRLMAEEEVRKIPNMEGGHVMNVIWQGVQVTCKSEG